MFNTWGVSFGTAWAESWTRSEVAASSGESDADIWQRRARKARAGTYLLLTEEQRKEKRKLFKRFSISGR